MTHLVVLGLKGYRERLLLQVIPGFLFFLLPPSPDSNMAEESLPELPKELLVHCSSCNSEVPKDKTVKVQKEDPIKGTNDQFRCSMCNNQRSKVSRMIAAKGLENGYKHMNAEERKQFQKDCQGLCGAALAKQLTDSITRATVRRITECTNEDGTFEFEEKVKEDFASTPDYLKILLEKAPRTNCVHTGVELIMVPKYTYQRKVEDIMEKREKLHLESEQAIKKVKVEKEHVDAKPPDQKGEGEADNSGEGANKDNKPPDPKDAKKAIKKEISQAQNKRIAKIHEKFEKVQFKAQATVVQCDCEAVKDWVPAAQLHKAKNLLQEMEKLIEMAKAFCQAGATASTNDLNAFFEACKLTDKPIQDSIVTLSDCLEACPSKGGA